MDPPKGLSLASVVYEYGPACFHDRLASSVGLIDAVYFCHAKGHFPSHLLFFKNSRVLFSPIVFVGADDDKSVTVSDFHEYVKEHIAPAKLHEILAQQSDETMLKALSDSMPKGAVVGGQHPDNAAQKGSPPIKTVIYANDDQPDGFDIRSCEAAKDPNNNETLMTVVLENESGRNAYNVRPVFDFHSPFGWDNGGILLVLGHDSVLNGHRQRLEGSFNTPRGVDVVRCYIRYFTMDSPRL